MGVDPLTIAVGALAVGTLGQTYTTVQAGKERRKAARAQQRIEARQSQRQQLAELRQSQIVRSSVSQQAATSGTADTSGYRGAVSSIQGTTASNIAFSQQIQGLQQYVGARLEKANKLDMQGAVVKSLTDVTAQIALTK